MFQLRVPQARVLKALYPRNGVKPSLTRPKLAVRAGFTEISGTITRALNGIKEGSSSAEAHQGLVAGGLVKKQVQDIDGASEVNYQITPKGITALDRYMADNRLPALRDKRSYINLRYSE